MKKNMITRKSFILWGTSVIAFASLFKTKLFNKIETPGTSKFLTQDGRLVEVENKHVKKSGIKMLTTELLHWIKK